MTEIPCRSIVNKEQPESRWTLSGKVWEMTGTAEAAREHRSVEEISE